MLEPIGQKPLSFTASILPVLLALVLILLLRGDFIRPVK